MKVIVNENRNIEQSGIAGTMNENNVTELEIVVPEKYKDYEKVITFITEDGVPPVLIENNKVPLTKAITKYKRVGYYISFIKGEDIWNSVEKELEFYNNTPADGEITDKDLGLVHQVVNILEEEITKVTDLEKEVQALIDNIQLKLDNGEFKGQDYVLTEEDKEEIVDTVKPMVETDIQPILENIENVANQAEVIAKGKSSSVVKDTWAEMEEWLKDISNKGTHKTGDNLYIKAKYKDETMTERQPDYWIAEVLEEPNEKGYYYEISELEADKPDLDSYAKKEQFVTLTQAEYNALTEKSANTYYFIIEEE